MNYTYLKEKQDENEYGLIYDLGSLFDYFNHINDSRVLPEGKGDLSLFRVLANTLRSGEE
jgi:hypothetical protein